MSLSLSTPLGLVAKHRNCDGVLNWVDMLGEVRVNRGAHRAVGNVEARESVASAASRCFIIGTGMMRCPKGSGRDRNTQEREDVVLLTIQQLSNQGTHARDKQGCNIDILDDVIACNEVAQRCGCVAAKSPSSTSTCMKSSRSHLTIELIGRRKI